MGDYVASRIIKCMLLKDLRVKDSEVLVLGFTFKENCPDVRNTKVVDVVRSLRSYGMKVTIYDPWVNPRDVEREYSLSLTNTLPQGHFSAVVLAVAHSEFMNIDIRSLLSPDGVVYDVKGCLPPHLVDDRL